MGEMPFDAVNVMGNVPLAVGVPLKTPALKVTPLGSAPDSVIVGAGNPTAVTVNEPAAPSANVVLLALVMAGASLTVILRMVVAVALDGVCESVTVTLKLVGPVAPLGVPESAPVLALMESHAGLPLRLHL